MSMEVGVGEFGSSSAENALDRRLKVGDANRLIVTAQNVRLMITRQVAIDTSTTSRQGTRTTGTRDVFVLMREAEMMRSHPETRIDHGQHRSYNYAAPDVMISGTMSLSSDLLGYMLARGDRNAVGVLPTYEWLFEVTDNTGNSVLLAAEGNLIETRTRKTDGPPGGPVDMDVAIRITDEDFKTDAVPADGGPGNRGPDTGDGTGTGTGNPNQNLNYVRSGDTASGFVTFDIRTNSDVVINEAEFNIDNRVTYIIQPSGSTPSTITLNGIATNRGRTSQGVRIQVAGQAAVVHAFTIPTQRRGQFKFVLERQNDGTYVNGSGSNLTTTEI